MAESDSGCTLAQSPTSSPLPPTFRLVPFLGKQNENAQSWLQTEQAVRDQLKGLLLETLRAEAVEAGRAAAQVIAEVAAIEVPHAVWPTLIPTLKDYVIQPGVQQLATLDALGFICEALLSRELLSALKPEDVDMVLTAVIQGMTKSEGKPSAIRLAATRALVYAVDFAEENFRNKEVEQKVIMQMVVEAATDPEDVQIRQAAFECLVVISDGYYDKMQPYIEHMYAISAEAIKKDEEVVALQAVEIWSTISELERSLMEELQETGKCDQPFLNIIVQASPALVPVLLEALTKQEEEDLEDSSWDLSSAAAVCLGNVAGVAGNGIVQHVWPFVQESIARGEWQYRDAATLALGYILDGPDSATLSPLISNVLLALLQRMQPEHEPVARVRDSTAWTVGRVCDFLHGSDVQQPIVTAETLPHIMAAAGASMDDEPTIAIQACGIVHNIALGYEDCPGSSPMSPYFQPVATKLLQCAARPTPGSSSLQLTAYDALNELIRTSSAQDAGLVFQLIPVIIQKLKEAFAVVPSTAMEKEGKVQLLGLLCGVLQIIIQKLGEADSNETKQRLIGMSDDMMTIFIQVMGSEGGYNEESVRAVGALADALGQDFAKYLQAFFPFLQQGLTNYEDHQTVSATVGLVEDLCRSLKKGIAPCCEQIVKALYEASLSNDLHKDVKPVILACFGEIALAVEEGFQPYLFLMQLLQSAASVSLSEQKDEEWIEYNNILRESILTAFSGILQALKKHAQAMEVLRSSYAHVILEYIESLHGNTTNTEQVLKNAICTLGDLVDCCGHVGPLLAQKPFYKQWLGLLLTNHAPNSQIGQMAAWVKSVIEKKCPGV